MRPTSRFQTVSFPFSQRYARHSLALIGALSVAACADRGAPSPPGVVVESDSAGVRILETAAPRFAAPAAPLMVDSAPQVVIGTEDSDDAYQLHRVSDATQLADGRLVVANAGSSELRVFDRDGRFLTQVGRAGSGPGEFAPFSSPRLYRSNDELLASDSELSRLHAFDSTLALRETRRFTITPDIPRPQLQGILDDGTWLAIAFDGGGALRGPPGSVIGTTFSLALYDGRGGFIRRFGSFAGRKRYVNTVGETTHYPHLPFTVDAVVRPYGRQILVFRGDRPEVELWSVEGKLETVIRWARDRVRSVDLYPQYRAQAIAALANAGERDRRLYGAFYEKELPLPEFAALYDNVVIDDAHRIWLHRYRMPGESGADQWDVIDSAGPWLGTATTPRGLEIFGIAADQIVGRMRDSLGVERIVLQSLRAAP